MSQRMIKLLILAALVSIVFIIPPPKGLSVEGWRMAGIFVTAIIGIIIQAIHEAPLLLIAVAFSALFVVPLKEVTVGLMDNNMWLVVSAVMLSFGFRKSGLARRVGLVLVSTFGKTSLRVAYCLSAMETILASAVPSSPARTGGLVFPLAEGFFSAVEEDSAKNPRKVAAFMTIMLYSVGMASGSLYITGISANPLNAKLAKDVLGISIDWTTWTYAALPSLLGILVIPYLLYKLYPPEIKSLEAMRQSVGGELAKMGRVTRSEWFASLTFITVLGLWATGSKTGIDATTTAFVGVSMMLLLEVIEWKDLAEGKEIWATLIWFGGILGLSAAMTKYGFFSWLAAIIKVALPTAGLPVIVILIIIALLANLPHYLFASSLGYVAAFAPLLFSFIAACDVPRYPAAFLVCFLMITSSSLTHYGNAVGPLLYGKGYVSKNWWWGLGLLTATFHTVVYLTLGIAWWKFIGYWY
ncbi:MAG: DASS family sodium-coupled anion symporter [Negativicutes bacterium]|nr:DASS family sodium-coupled anion symporter [Negativicutes bacterium]